MSLTSTPSVPNRPFAPATSSSIWTRTCESAKAIYSLDIVSLLQAGEYQDTLLGNSTWFTGDWNADGEFDRADLVLALQDGGYGQGPRAAMAAVPEPATIVLAFAGLGTCLAIHVYRRMGNT